MHFAICIDTLIDGNVQSFAAVGVEPNQASKLFYQRVTCELNNPEYSDLAVVTHNFLLFLLNNNAKVLIAHDYMHTKNILERCIDRSNLSPVLFEWKCTLQLSYEHHCRYTHIFDCCYWFNVNIFEFEHFKPKRSLHSSMMCAELFKSFFTSEKDKDLDYGLSIVNEQIFKESKFKI